MRLLFCVRENKGRYIMGLIELLLLAVGLSMDAFAVSVCKGLAMGGVKPRHMLICGAWFGGFQALMPMIGYLLGAAFENVISAVSSWIAFGLLVLIGGNMLREALSKDEEKETNKMDVRTMFMLAVATSIDACVAGISLYFMNVGIVAAAALIGAVCFVCTVAGFYFSRVFCRLPTACLQIAAGCVLILLGVKVLYEHLS